MPSQDDGENQQKKKSTRRNERPIQPGAQNAGPTPIPTELEYLERRISEKKCPRLPSTTPGAFKGADLNILDHEPHVAASEREERNESSIISRDLEQLEGTVDSKVRIDMQQQHQPYLLSNPNDMLAKDEKRASHVTNSAPTLLTAWEQQVAVKQDEPFTHRHVGVDNTQNEPSQESDTDKVVAKNTDVKDDEVANKGKDGNDSNGFLDEVESRFGLGILTKADEDLEYGEFGGPDEQGLAVAFEVEEDDDDAYIPSAVQFDPDAKPSMVKNRRFHLYVFLTVIFVVVGCLGAAVGLTVAARKTKQGIPYRETIGIRETAAYLFGNAAMEDLSSPYSLALDWIIFEDPKQLSPDDPTFSQRLTMAAFYFATSTIQPWSGGCQKPVTEDEKSTVLCQHEFFRWEGEVFAQPAQRWLGGGDECRWYGVRCDALGQVQSLILGV